MWNKLKTFNDKHFAEISWFFIGIFSLSFLYSIGRGDWLSATIDAFLVCMNYYIYETRK